MKAFYRLTAILACVLLTGCGNVFSNAGPSAPPAPASHGLATDVMRAGDKITVRLTGVPDGEYVMEIQIPSNGNITVPLLTRTFQAAGRNSADLATEISAAYKEGKIYTNPNVTVIAEDRFLTVGGDVRGPGRVAYTPDMTVLTAINSMGGFTEYADRKHVHIIRGSEKFEVDCVAAARTPGMDPPVYPGDQITVPRTPF